MFLCLLVFVLVCNPALIHPSPRTNNTQNQFSGVYKRGGRFCAHILDHEIGWFDSVEEAARAVDMRLIVLTGLERGADFSA